MGFFKAYDMRGTFGVDFDLDTVYRVGRALPKVVPGRRWLVGRDCRGTSASILEALVKGLGEAGVEVVNIGLCTTPMVYFFTAQDGFDGSVMITASHNPPTDNGLKVSMSTALPVGYANGLDAVERLVAADAAHFEPDRAFQPASVSPEHLARYLAWQKEQTDSGLFSGLKYAVDASCGMASLLVRELFPGARIINDKLDGSFPCHSPNPLDSSAREQVSRLVREERLDCAIIFDGDADRAMFVDENGCFVQSDYLIPIVARATMARLAPTERQGVKIIHDVRTSRGAIEAIREMGCESVMVPVGHAFAKPLLRKTGALCGGELAGHYYFREFYGCDSGILAALRILGEIAAAKKAGATFSEMMRPIAGRYANSGELNFKIADKDAAISRVLASAKQLGTELSRSTMDGTRIEFAEGWINVRKSNTEPYLRILAECDTSARLHDWKRLLTEAVGCLQPR